MRKWTIGIGLCGALLCASFVVAYTADRRLGVVAPWSLLLAPVLVLAGCAGVMRGLRSPEFVRPTLRPGSHPDRPASRPTHRGRTIEGFVLFSDRGAAAADEGTR